MNLAKVFRLVQHPRTSGQYKRNVEDVLYGKRQRTRSVDGGLRNEGSYKSITNIRERCLKETGLINFLALRTPPCPDLRKLLQESRMLRRSSLVRDSFFADDRWPAVER